MDTKRLRNKRIRLWQQDSRCFWCGNNTLLLKAKKSKKLRKQDFENPLRATIDHLVYYGHVLRNPQTDYGKSYCYNHLVIACNNCNAERSVKQSKLNNTRLKILKQGTKPSFCIL